MTTKDPEVRSFDRSCALICATPLALLAVGCLFIWIDVRLQAREANSSPGFGLLLFVVPVVVTFLHYQWQSPRRSSMPLALATASISLFFGLLLLWTVGLWFHVKIGGAL